MFMCSVPRDISAISHAHTASGPEVPHHVHVLSHCPSQFVSTLRNRAFVFETQRLAHRLALSVPEAPRHVHAKAPFAER